MKLINKVKNMEIEFRQKLNDHLKNGDIEFDTPVNIDDYISITEVLKCGLCNYVDDNGNEYQLETRTLSIFELAMILDEIEGN